MKGKKQQRKIQLKEAKEERQINYKETTDRLMTELSTLTIKWEHSGVSSEIK